MQGMHAGMLMISEDYDFGYKRCFHEIIQNSMEENAMACLLSGLPGFSGGYGR
jgi:hypothetical protein